VPKPRRIVPPLPKINPRAAAVPAARSSTRVKITGRKITPEAAEALNVPFGETKTQRKKRSWTEA